MDSQRLVTVPEAADRLGRSTEQVRRYLREGKLKGTRIGGQWFIDRFALDRFNDDLKTPTSFLEKLKPARENDPLSAVIGIGRGGGDIAQGKVAYRQNYRWRR